MLFNIVTADDKDAFEKYIEKIKEFYFPEAGYKAYKEKIPTKKSILETKNDIEAVQKIEEELKKIPETFCADTAKTGYPILKKNGELEENHPSLSFPHIERFHKFFLERKWIPSIDDPQDEKSSKYLFDLKYSKNKGNYYHFVNVVACLARLIMYFKKRNKKTFNKQKFFGDDLSDAELDILLYKNKPNIRTFKLMLSAFYHDIGKTVIDQRHSIEGEIIMLGQQTGESIVKLNEIAKKHKLKSESDNKKEVFLRDDLLFVAKMVCYHDQFGTLGTGEDGYLRLVDLIDLLKTLSSNKFYDVQNFDVNRENPSTQKISLKDQKEKQYKWSQRGLFDLWLLNIADIIVSDDKKWKDQIIVTDKNKREDQSKEGWCFKESAKAKIRKFFEQERGKRRIHDLRIAFYLLKEHFQRDGKLKIHASDTKKIEDLAVNLSRAHTTERLRRLITSSLRVPLNNLRNDSETKKKTIRLITHIEKKLEKNDWVFAINRSLELFAAPQEFFDRFSWIGKMDYSLGFFRKIAEGALTLVRDELDKNGPTTGWIRNPKEKIDCKDDDFLCLLDAQYFLDNYTATVIKIISYLLFREASINSPKDFQFAHSALSLTKEKIRRMLSLVGPYQSDKSIYYVLQDIYIF